MYGTLGAGFYGMFAFFSLIGGGAAAVLLGLDGRWVSFTLVLAGASIATCVFLKLERDHFKALKECARSRYEPAD